VIVLLLALILTALLAPDLVIDLLRAAVWLGGVCLAFGVLFLVAAGIAGYL